VFIEMTGEQTVCIMDCKYLAQLTADKLDM